MGFFSVKPWDTEGPKKNQPCPRDWDENGHQERRDSGAPCEAQIAFAGLGKEMNIAIVNHTLPLFDHIWSFGTIFQMVP